MLDRSSILFAVKAHFDGNEVILPDTLPPMPPGDVILVFENGRASAPAGAASDWLKAQEPPFAKRWDNDKDSAYSSL